MSTFDLWDRKRSARAEDRANLAAPQRSNEVNGNPERIAIYRVVASGLIC